MTELEMKAFEEIIQQTIWENIDNGMLAAVEMIRIAAKGSTLTTFDQLADSIEEMVYTNDYPGKSKESLKKFQECIKA